MNRNNTPPTGPTDPHWAMLATYFFGYIDRGISADETPLFTRSLEGLPLSNVIAENFSLSLPDAESAIEAARQEVWL